MEQRARTSTEQFSILVEYMERNGDIARPQPGAQGRIKADRLWQQLTEILNSVGGGTAKPLEKWKKVWADWKSKTKMKSREMMKHRSGTGGGPSTKQSLTALEERVLGVIGVLAVEGVAINEQGFHQLQENTPFSVDAIPDVLTSDVGVEDMAGSSTQVNEPSALPRPPSARTLLQAMPPAAPTPAVATLQAMLPAAPTPAAETATVRQREATPPATPTTPQSPARTPRRRPLQAQRRRRAQTPFDRATSEFAAVELRRLQLEELREQNLHERESRRIAVEADLVSVLKRLADLAERFIDRH